MGRQEGFEILTQGDVKIPEVELILRDEDGIWASRCCAGDYDIARVLSGWSVHYPCDVHHLFSVTLTAETKVACLVKSWMTRPQQKAYFLSPEEARRLIELTAHPYRPRELRELRHEIHAGIRAATMRTEATGVLDHAQMDRVIELMRQRDVVATNWARGLID